MIVSLLSALLATFGGHFLTVSDVSGGPVSIAPHSFRVQAPGRAAGGVHTLDVSGGPVSVAPHSLIGGRRVSDVSGGPVSAPHP